LTNIKRGEIAFVTSVVIFHSIGVNYRRDRADYCNLCGWGINIGRIIL